MNHYAAEAANREIPTCPKCRGQAQEVKTKYGLRNRCCDLWSWDRHPLVDAKTHEARNAAHKAFDRIWKDGHAPRGKAYAMLREELGICKEQCHMKLMDAETALKVPAAVDRIRERLSA